MCTPKSQGLHCQIAFFCFSLWWRKKSCELPLAFCTENHQILAIVNLPLIGFERLQRCTAVGVHSSILFCIILLSLNSLNTNQPGDSLHKMANSSIPYPFSATTKKTEKVFCKTRAAPQSKLLFFNIDNTSQSNVMILPQWRGQYHDIALVESGIWDMKCNPVCYFDLRCESVA